MSFSQQNIASPVRRRFRRERGAAAILAMMFLVIFSSLAAAMAIVSQGNLATADSNLKMNRALAAAETGMRFMVYRINQESAKITTRAGLIDGTNAPALWTALRNALQTSFTGEVHNLSEPSLNGSTLTIGPIAVGPNSPTFIATLTPHPLAGENYNAAYYQRPPYSQMVPAVSSSNPLDSTWIRVKVSASDGPVGRQITRSISMDFKLEKKIRFAVLSKSRVMIGANVMIEGPIGSRFTDTNLTNGHPVQMQSDFAGLDTALDASLTPFINTLKTNDVNGDNRLNVNDAAEINGMTNPAQYDKNGDGYIEDYDFFLARFDANADGKISNSELNTAGDVRRAQLMALIDTFGDPTRSGYNDGFIDNSDRYAKIKGSVLFTAAMAGWNNGAAGGAYQNYFQGPIRPDTGQSPIQFEASDASVHQFEADDFDVTTYRNLATGDLAAQAATQAAQYNPADPSSPRPLGTQVREAVPYGSQHPYDFYDRPVYENMTFTNVKIPKGTNALFKNCKFIGCTFVETTKDNTDTYYNYVGMQQADGSPLHPEKTATVNGGVVSDTKPLSNNLRFDGCTFEGAVVSDATTSFTNARNKLSFTGTTKFDPNAASLTASQKLLFKRSTLLAPNYSVEMGTFINPSDSKETVNLSGTIVAGVVDMRGQVKVDGTLLTTFMPQNGTGPVTGNTSPDFNTTLGYFASTNGDKEGELPTTAYGLGVIQIRYNKDLPLPDGILGPISLTPNTATYFEGGN
ncbi:MAG: hypothetical protein IT444_01840 [Phycisphaeraceae bacterium]|nr:hypothetical protein [Phycisphaeraceae bacterium]